MVGFGPKQAWLALAEDDRADVGPGMSDAAAPGDGVAAALGLRDLGSVGWRSGVDLAYLTDDRLVLTPPLLGAHGTVWRLLAGRWLLRYGHPVDLELLSGKLGTEVQYFATYRVGEIHRWVRASNGSLLRAFGYSGETGEVTAWLGEPDAAELAIGLLREPDGADVLVSERDVMRLAATWSVDPTTVDDLPAPGSLQAFAVDLFD